MRRQQTPRRIHEPKLIVPKIIGKQKQNIRPPLMKLLSLLNNIPGGKKYREANPRQHQRQRRDLYQQHHANTSPLRQINARSKNESNDALKHLMQIPGGATLAKSKQARI